jgi:isochorismate hydrolase
LPGAYESRIQRAGIVNAWADPEFAAAGKAAGKNQLIMAGVTTDVCLVFPSMSAMDAGLKCKR